MKNNESENSIIPNNSNGENTCNLKDLIEMMGGKRHLIKGIMDSFLNQIPEEMHNLNEAVEKMNYASIKSIAHSMRSTVSIMGISILSPVLKEMEELGTMATNIDHIKELNEKVNIICNKSIEEIKQEMPNYA